MTLPRVQPPFTSFKCAIKMSFFLEKRAHNIAHQSKIMIPSHVYKLSYEFKSCDLKLFLPCKYFFKKYSTKPKIIASLDDVVVEGTNPKKHPGVQRLKAVEIPRKYLNAITNVLKDQQIGTLVKEADLLRNYLHSRQPPLEPIDLKSKISEIAQQVDNEDAVDIQKLSDEEKVHLKKIRDGKVKRLVGQKVYNWKPIEYDDQMCRLYLLARSVADFAVLARVFSEIKSKYPDFSPKTLFDFGSGVGTVTWAVRETWESVKEYFCVDSSKHMIELADLLLRNGNEMNEHPFSGVFFRQFLPSSQTLKYDLVVSAYSLMDLPSSQSRLETILNLWNKTSGYLVLIENGTKAGFRVLNEARDFILEFTKNSDTLAHTVAPCPHDLQCPKTSLRVPCTFPVKYFTLPIGRNQESKHEIFSYVVLKKGTRPETDPRWPRLIDRTLVKSKHSICRMCCSNGKLEEIIFTASRHGKFAYHCARASKWGDLLPVKLSVEDIK